MKIFISIAMLLLTSTTFASGSWKISCTSETGVGFISYNGQAEIQFTTIDTDGLISTKSSDVAIENYDLGYDKKNIEVNWIGKQSVTEDRYENSCNRDQVLTVFSQQIEIKDSDKKSAQIVNVVCREEIITGSGAELDECLE